MKKKTFSIKKLCLFLNPFSYTTKSVCETSGKVQKKKMIQTKYGYTKCYFYFKRNQIEITKNMYYIWTYLSTDIQHKWRILAVEKYTSKLLYTLHINRPNIQRPDNMADALNVIAHKATNISAIANDTTK